MTVAMLGQKRIRGGIPHEATAAFDEHEFGRQEVEGLELLSMSEPADEDGYYYCFRRCPFARL